MAIMVACARGTGLSVHSVRDIGPDYAVTLRHWRRAWETGKEEVRGVIKQVVFNQVHIIIASHRLSCLQVLALGYSERFWRKYRFYFAYCEAGFDAQYIHTYQVEWRKDSVPTVTDADIAESGGGSSILVPCTSRTQQCLHALWSSPCN